MGQEVQMIQAIQLIQVDKVGQVGQECHVGKKGREGRVGQVGQVGQDRWCVKVWAGGPEGSGRVDRNLLYCVFYDLLVVRRFYQ